MTFAGRSARFRLSIPDPVSLERFGRVWCAFSLGDLVIPNFALLVTEGIGVTLSLGYFGISRYVAIPVAAGALIAVRPAGASAAGSAPCICSWSATSA